MEVSPVVSLLIPLIAPIVITALRRPLSRVEERTTRLQFWKVLLEVTPLVRGAISDETKQLCIRDLDAAEDELQKLENQMVGFLSKIFTLILIFSGFCIIDRTMLFTDDLMRRQAQGHEAELNSAMEQIGFMSLILQSLFACMSWFWARWKITDLVWDHFRPGRGFHFLLTASDPMKAFVKLIMLVLLALAFRLVVLVIWQVPQYTLGF